MKKMKSIIRITTILATSIVALCLICAEPNNESWMATFIATKAIGFGMGYITYRLAIRWHNDPLIGRYEAWCKEA